MAIMISMARDQQLNVRLTTEEHRLLQALIARTGLTKTGVVKLALRHLAREEHITEGVMRDDARDVDQGRNPHGMADCYNRSESFSPDDHHR